MWERRQRGLDALYGEDGITAYNLPSPATVKTYVNIFRRYKLSKRWLRIGMPQ
jgi:hypothetical protein